MRPHCSSNINRLALSEYPLPEGWRSSLPQSDHQWVAQELFKFNSQGKVELKKDKIRQLWWYPPQPTVSPSMAPRHERWLSNWLCNGWFILVIMICLDSLSTSKTLQIISHKQLFIYYIWTSHQEGH